MLKVSDELDQLLVAKVYEAEQQHVFAFWDELSEAQRRGLLDQLRQIDFQLLGKLIKLIDAAPSGSKGIAPAPIESADAERRERLARVGWDALKAGEVACLVVAGGQGTRLGWDAPKGTYPVGPVSEKPLFQLFAEQLRTTSGEVARTIPWYVLTSSLNRATTEQFFAENDHFGLAAGQVGFLQQKDLPNTDPHGLLLMAAKDRVAVSPNGHGGVFQALRDEGVLDALARDGVEQLFYFQVDNPLCRVPDPVFLGAHIEGKAEASTKVVIKEDPAEKIGLIALRDGKTTVVEYSEMSEEEQQARDPDGQLTYRGGNTAIHVFDVAFLRGLVDRSYELAYHVAKKKVPCVDATGAPVEPSEPNAIKFETFIFEVLSEAERHVAFEVERAEGFEPLKNAEGPYSPATVRQAISDRSKRWIDAAGLQVPDAQAYEVSPLTALDAGMLAREAEELTIEAKDGKVHV